MGASSNVYAPNDVALRLVVLCVRFSRALSSVTLCEPKGEVMGGDQPDAGPSASSDTRKTRTLAAVRKKKRQVEEGGLGVRACSTTRTVGSTRSTNSKKREPVGGGFDR